MRNLGGEKTMNRKIIKSNGGYVIGGYCKWHSFMESFIKVVIGLGVLAVLTLPIWA
jgi:hypothetical protein